MDNFQVLRDMKPEELQELLNIYRAKNEGLTLGGQLHKPVMVNTMEESLLASLPNTSGQIDPMTGLRSFNDNGNGNGNGNGDNGGGGYDESKDSDRLGGDTHDTPPDDGLSEIERHHQNYLKSLEKQGSGDGGYTPPPPPPKYKDKLGREYNTQAEANAANVEIDDERASLAGNWGAITIDDDYDSKKSEAGTFKHLPESEIRAHWDKQMAAAQKEAANQVVEAGQDLYNQLMLKDENGNYTNLNKTYQQFVADGGTMAGTYARLGNRTIEGLWNMAREKAQRFEAFELTPQEIQQFAREAVQVTDQVDDATRTDIAAPTPIEAPTIQAPEEVTQTTIGEFGFDRDTDEVLYDRQFTDKVRGKSDQLFEVLYETIMGRRDSPAQQQARRESENLMKSFLSAIAGTEAAPEKRRQLQTAWAEQGNILIRDTAALRSQEEAAARQQMLQLIEIDGGREAKLALADLEARRQEAFKNADLDQVRKIGNAQMKLTSVLAEADTELKARLANLEAEKQVAIKNGELEVATELANMQKNLTIATINAELAIKSRGMDDALAIEAYRGKKEFYGLEVKIDLAQMEADLKMMGFELTRDLAEMDDATKRYIAELTAKYKSAQARNEETGMWLNMIATGVAAYAKLSSDERMKQNISSGDREIEQFLDAIDAYQYEYKDPKAIGRDSGLLIGIMAQDAERGGPMGNAMVSNGPRGKQLDMNQGLAAVMAAQANLHKRTKQLEGRA